MFFLVLFEIVHITWLDQLFPSTNWRPKRNPGGSCNGQILLAIFSQSLGDRHLFHWDLHHHLPWGKRLDVENGPICGLFDRLTRNPWGNSTSFSKRFTLEESRMIIGTGHTLPHNLTTANVNKWHTLW